jgi:hypothetical protein
MRILPAFVLLAYGALAACGAPDPQTQQWKPIATDELIEALQSPTGTFEGDNLDSVVEDLEEVLGPLLDTQLLLIEIQRVTSGLADLDDAGVADAGELRPTAPPPEERGTRFFVLLSCPGPDGDDVDFGHGSARIDTPTLKDLTNATLGESGDFLLSYDDCQGKASQVNGSSPGYYDLNQETFLFDYQVTHEDLQTGKKVEYAGPLLYVAGTLDVLLGPVDANYRVEFEPPPSTVLGISGATESIQCTLDRDALTITCD